MSQCGADRSIRRVGVQSDVPIGSLCAEKNAPDGFSSGACLPVPVAHSHSVARKDFEQVVFAVLLGEEQPRPVFLECSWFRSNRRSWRLPRTCAARSVRYLHRRTPHRSSPSATNRATPCFSPDAARSICRPKSNRAYSADRATSRRDLLSPGPCLCRPRT